MDMDFAVSGPLVRRSRLVPGSCPSTCTFAPRFLQTSPRGDSPCVFANPSPPSGWVEDFHLQATEHAQHTTKSLCDSGGLGYQRQRYAVCEPAAVTRLCGSEFGACFAGPHSPWSPPLAPLTPQQIAPLCSSTSQLLWRSPTSHARWRLHLLDHLVGAAEKCRWHCRGRASLRS